MGDKVTVITTVLNEEDSILAFLDSIYNQTRRPDEVIIVDGGSTDNTVKLLQSSKFTIIQKKGNRSVGRNTAIRASSNNIIAVTDAGCILDTYWLERIVTPYMKKDIDVVSGFYKPLATTIFQKCLATYTCTMPDRLDKKNFLPSSRSVAFKKKAWEKVKGYPENLDTCEDLVFDKRLKNAGFAFVMVPNAVVYWPQRKNIFQAARQFYGYARGDGRARYFRLSTPFLFGRYFLGVLIASYALLTSFYLLQAGIVVAFLGYLIWAVYKNSKYIRSWRKCIYLPLLQLVSDVAVITGTTFGFITSLRKE